MGVSKQPRWRERLRARAELAAEREPPNARRVGAETGRRPHVRTTAGGNGRPRAGRSALADHSADTGA